jgi:hypothetical protein
MPRAVTVRNGLAGVLACLAVLAAPVRAQDSSMSPPRTARVTYLTSASAYIDAGRDAGLREGALVQVIRGGAVIGVLKVAFLASRQASCDIVSQSTPIALGDSVRFRAAVPPRDSTVAARPVAVQTGLSRTSLRGNAGAHYLVVGQGPGSGFTQPSLDLRLDGRPVPNGPIGLSLDIRARRTVSTLAGGTAIDGHARAYQLALSWNPASSPGRITLGRQLAPYLAVVGVFDGVLAEVNKPQWSAGVFSGSQPDPLSLAFATDVLEAGGYVQRRSRPGGRPQWSTTFGLSGSYQNAHANREFAFLQASFSNGRFSSYISQEIDYYRWWKRTPGMAAISPTSTFATARYRASNGLEVHAGFDNRRNVLLYRDFVNPVTTFDDAFRQGVWAGAELRWGRRYSIGVDARQSSGGPSGRANSYTVSLGADRVTPLGMGVRARSTYFRSQQINGWLNSLALALDPGSRLHFELSGGARIERDPLANPTSQSILWGGLDLDVNLARAWYLMLSGITERGAGAGGGGDGTSQIYGGLSTRF